MRKKSAIRRLLRLLFNQLGFDKPEYRQRLKTLMSVEDNMYTNVKSSIGHEIERAKREKALKGETVSESLPVAVKTQPAVNPEKTRSLMWLLLQVNQQRNSLVDQTMTKKS